MNRPARFRRVVGADEPVFAEPWEARAFAMAVSLHERGLYTWSEWADALASRITASPAHADPDVGDTYYQHWLDALEDLLARKGIGSAETARWRAAWQLAANRTAHCAQIDLQAEDFEPAHIAGTGRK
jgi:nitrile hydratase accessory protein